MFDKIQMILMMKTSILNNRISRLNKEYHGKDVKRNAWTEIGEKLGLEGNQLFKIILRLVRWNYCFRKQPVVHVLRWIQDRYSIKDGALYDNV